MEIILVAAMAANRVIGHRNSIPWHIPGEQQRFKELTWGHPLIMGRKTWESIGRPLPGRKNIVVTRNPSYRARGAEIVHSLSSALDLCQDQDKVFVIGGAQLYRLALPLADTMILSILKRPVTGDTYFPKFSENQDFQLISSRSIPASEPYRINVYRKIKGSFPAVP